MNELSENKMAHIEYRAEMSKAATEHVSRIEDNNEEEGAGDVPSVSGEALDIPEKQGDDLKTPIETGSSNF